MIVPVSGLHTNDRVRGIGLIVEKVEPLGQNMLSVEGYTLAKDGKASPAKLVAEADHMVRIARPFEPTNRVTVPASYLDADAVDVAAMLGTPYIEVEIDEVRADERQIIVFDPISSEPLEERDRFAVPFRAARHAVPTA